MNIFTHQHHHPHILIYISPQNHHHHICCLFSSASTKAHKSIVRSHFGRIEPRHTLRIIALPTWWIAGSQRVASCSITFLVKLCVPEFSTWLNFAIPFLGLSFVLIFARFHYATLHLYMAESASAAPSLSQPPSALTPAAAAGSNSSRHQQHTVTAMAAAANGGSNTSSGEHIKSWFCCWSLLQWLKEWQVSSKKTFC